VGLLNTPSGGWERPVDSRGRERPGSSRGAAAMFGAMSPPVKLWRA